jgi:uncharacterized protein YbjT (DUF2867 family)
MDSTGSGCGENEGVRGLPLGNGRHAPISGRDQANVIAAILQNPDPHDRQSPLVGPKANVGRLTSESRCCSTYVVR